MAFDSPEAATLSLVEIACSSLDEPSLVNSLFASAERKLPPWESMQADMVVEDSKSTIMMHDLMGDMIDIQYKHRYFFLLITNPQPTFHHFSMTISEGQMIGSIKVQNHQFQLWLGGCHHISELNQKVSSSDSEATPSSLLDLTLLGAVTLSLGGFFFSPCSILSFVSLRSLLTFMKRCRRSLISWSFLVFTSSIEMYFLRSRQLSWIEILRIQPYLSYNFRYSSRRLAQRSSQRSLLPFCSYSFSLFTQSQSDLMHSSFLLSAYDQEVESFYCIFKPRTLLLLAKCSFSSVSLIFLCWRRSSWFCKFLRLAMLFLFILHSFSVLLRDQIVQLARSKFRQLASRVSLRCRSSALRAVRSSLALATSSPNFFICYYCQLLRERHFSFYAVYCCAFFYKDFSLANDSRARSASPPREHSFELCYRVCSMRSREEFLLLLRNGTARGGRVSLPREEWLLFRREGLVGDLRCSAACYCLPSRKGETMPSRPFCGEEQDWD